MNRISIPIGPRVALAFGAVVLTIVAMTAVVLAGLARSADNAEQKGQSMRVQNQAGEALFLAKDNAIASLVVLVSSSPDQQSKLQREMAARDERILASLGALEAANAGAPDRAALVAEARKRHATYVAGVRRITGMVLAGKQAEAAFAADEEMIPMLAPFLAALAAVDAAETERVKQLELAGSAANQATQRLTAVAALVAVLLSATAGILLVRSITRPLRQALVVAEQVAGGDLSNSTAPAGRDELSMLLQTLARMTRSLSQMVARTRDVADGVATGSAQIASGNSDLASRTEQQASTLQQTASSMAELGSTVARNADHARQADALAQRASTVAAQGGQVVGQVIDTMRGIDQSSRRIADIIGVIDGIAFQTNILALNAAVEAARAGEQGRGFAVVASEVRGLAQRSATAAREIKGLIAASVDQVRAGSALVDQAGSTMHDVLAAISQVSQIMAEINAASQSQSEGVVRIGEAVAQMDHGTQQNAALVEQSAAAAESLRSQSEQLMQSMAAFKLA